MKLTLETARPDDRRIRHAHVKLLPSSGEPQWDLFTDTNGCMHYRLEDGDYRICVEDGPSAEFRVSDHRWTFVRLRLR